MPHFRVDDGLEGHPKSQRAGDEALGMWVRAGSWCMRYLTDGFVPDWWVKQQPRGAAKAKRLVDAGFWRPAENAGEKGWQFHEFTGPGRQDSREKIEAEREAARQRKANWRATQSQQESRRDGRKDGRRTPGTNPTQPNPTQDDYSSSEESSPNVGGGERGLTVPVNPSASRLVATLVPEAIPSAVRTGLRLSASELMNRDGLDGDAVAESLRRWMAKPGAGVGLLAHIAADVVRERAAPANGSTNKLRATASLAARQRAAENAQTTTGLKELE